MYYRIEDFQRHIYGIFLSHFWLASNLRCLKWIKLFPHLTIFCGLTGVPSDIFFCNTCCSWTTQEYAVNFFFYRFFSIYPRIMFWSLVKGLCFEEIWYNNFAEIFFWIGWLEVWLYHITALCTDVANFLQFAGLSDGCNLIINLFWRTP